MGAFFNWTVIASLLSIILALPSHHRQTRVAGGNTAKPGQFPFMVVLTKGMGQVCGGAIISKHWIVTTAYCVDNTLLGDYFVLAGTNKIYEGGIKYSISNITLHPEYDETLRTNDLALVKIKGEFAFSDTIQPIKISNVTVNETCVVMGWGSKDITNVVLDLQYAEIRALSEDECAKMGNGITDLKTGPGQVCGLGRRNVGPCSEDRGDPLVANGKLVGIFSYNLLPCTRGWSDVYTRVSYYADWIKKVLTE